MHNFQNNQKDDLSNHENFNSNIFWVNLGLPVERIGKAPNSHFPQVSSRILEYALISRLFSISRRHTQKPIKSSIKKIYSLQPRRSHLNETRMKTNKINLNKIWIWWFIITLYNYQNVKCWMKYITITDGRYISLSSMYM